MPGARHDQRRAPRGARAHRGANQARSDSALSPARPAGSGSNRAGSPSRRGVPHVRQRLRRTRVALWSGAGHQPRACGGDHLGSRTSVDLVEPAARSGVLAAWLGSVNRQPRSSGYCSSSRNSTNRSSDGRPGHDHAAAAGRGGAGVRPSGRGCSPPDRGGECPDLDALRLFHLPRAVGRPDVGSRRHPATLRPNARSQARAAANPARDLTSPTPSAPPRRRPDRD